MKNQYYHFRLNNNTFFHFTCILLSISLFLIFTLLVSGTDISEDAYIIFRYAENIAKGNGFVWNPGDEWIWGSTSLTWTLLLSLFSLFGLPLTLIAPILGIIIGTFLILINYIVAVVIMKLRRESAFFASLLLSTGHLCVHALLGFETLLFTLLIYLVFVLTIIHSSDSRFINKGTDTVLLITAFILSFTRPEGLIIAITAYIALFVLERNNWRVLLRFFAMFLVSVLIAYLILFLIFGQPFPNPFYLKKGTSLLYSASITQAWFYYGKGIIGYLFVLLSIQFIIGETKDSWKYLWLIVPYLVFILSYFSINQSQNIASRFQYPIVPIIVIIAVKSLDTLFSEIRLHSTDLWSFLNQIISIRQIQNNYQWFLKVIFLFFLLSVNTLGTFNVAPVIDSCDKIVVGEFLNSYQDKNYTILLTEAGMLSFYSKWYIVDAWGLNSAFIVHHGLSAEYINRYEPEIIQFHVYHSNFTDEWKSSTSAWEQMSETLYNYAIAENYTLSCIIESWSLVGSTFYQSGYQWYFIKPGFQDYLNILTGINNLPVQYFYRGI